MDTLVIIIITFMVLFILLKNINSKITNLSVDIQNLQRKINELNSNIFLQNNKKGSTESDTFIKPDSSKDIPIKKEKLSNFSINPNIKIVEKSNIPDILDDKTPKQEEIKKEEISLEKVIPQGFETKHDSVKNLQKDPPRKKKKEKSDLEKYFSENILSKIGIVTLILGVTYFVKYAIDKDWINEIGRVAIGLLTGISIIGVAHKLKTNYKTFSSILVGGGISVLYISITIAFREYDIFSQSVAFIFLIFITIFSVFLSILYDKKELAIFSLLGGFASPLMISSGSGNYIVLFSYILILNSGMLFLAFKKNWKLISIISYVATLLFYWSWLVITAIDEELLLGGLIFGILFFIQFYILTLILFLNEKKLTVFQTSLILGNNISIFGASILLFQNHYSIPGIISIALATVNTIPLYILFKKKLLNNNMIFLLISVVLTFITLAVPIQLKGSMITLFWAAETVILLFLWKKSNIKTFGLGFIILQILVCLSLILDWKEYQFNDYRIILNTPFITGAFFIITNILNIYILKQEKDIDKNFTSGIAIKNIIYFQKITTLVLLFLVPFIELFHQTFFIGSEQFRIYIYLLYVYFFISLLILFRNKTRINKILLNTISYASGISLLLYLICVYYVVFDVVFDVNNIVPPIYFFLHYLFIIPFIIIAKYLLTSKHNNIVNWIAFIILMIILSLEADFIAIYNTNSTNIYNTIFNTHTIVYPIIWGISAFIFMLLGIKKGSKTLRIMSLSLFALIILKLYIYDVWQMEKIGRIIAFITLGIILLASSFIYQKLKNLFIEEDKTTENKEENIDQSYSNEND